MNIFKHSPQRSALVLVASLAIAESAQAQTATWNNVAADNNWNTAGNWDVGTPLEGTNAIIGVGFTVNYNAPMVATAFAGVNNTAALTVNAGGFNIGSGAAAAYTGNAASLLRINAGGVVTITNSGVSSLLTSSEVAVDGGVLIMTNNTGNFTVGVNGNFAGAGFTNNGGTVIISQPFQSRGRFTRVAMNGGTLDLQGGGGILESSNDQERQFLINGGTANLGNFTVSRTLQTLAAGGLVISNGNVSATSLQIGNTASRAGSSVMGGTLTNTGSFTINDRANSAVTGERRVFFYVRGGTVVSSVGTGIIVGNQANVGAASATIMGGNLDVGGTGLLIAEGITLVKDTTLINVHGTLLLGTGGTIYLGSVGLNGNLGVSGTSYTVTLSGGTIGASSDFSINANATVSGALTLKASDVNNVAHNITNNSVWSGSGSLTKTGGGVLTLNSNNTYTGSTTISAGTLALGATGTIPNSGTFTVASGATFDISGPGGFTLGSSKTLTGLGNVVGNFTNASASTINPATGTLTFANSLNQSGGTINHFDLPTTPGPGNDRVNITGDLNVSGVNTVEIVGGGAPGSVHTLIQYGGNFNGTLANFSLIGATGILSNHAPSKTISLVIQAAIRNATNVVWVGNAVTNDWDSVNKTNWNASGALTYFVTGDNALFNNTGTANPNVNLIGNLQPATLTVGASGNYSFSGGGNIGGATGITKTNIGTLTINTTNSYLGVTTISGGVLEAGSIGNGNINSAIGAATSASANLVIDGGTLRYIGAGASTDRGATLGAANGAVDVSNGAATLTVGGTVIGTGALIKHGAGTLALGGANTHTGGTIIGNGTLQLSVATAASTGGITNYGGAIRGPNSTVTIVNVMDVNGNCTIDTANSSGDFHLTGAWSGSGNVNVINFPNAARTLTLGGGGNGGGGMTNFTGTVSMGTNGGHLRFNDGGGNNNLGNPAMTLDMGTGAGDFNVRNGGVTVQFGALSGGSATTVSGRASGASGTVTYSIGALNLPTTFAGNIRNGANGTALTKVGTASLTLTGTNTYTGITVVNDGTLQVDGSLSGTTSVTVIGGKLSGNGSISGAVDIQTGATLSPGASIGQLTMTGSLTLQPGGTNLMEINKTVGTNDAVVGLVSVTYGGTLVINNLAGTLADGDTFKLFDSASYAGAYDTLQLPTLGALLFWDTSKLTVNGTIRVFTPRPGVTSFGISGSNFFLTGTNNGNTSTHYIVITSTNVSVPQASWTPVFTNLFDGSGNLAFTNAVNLAEPQRFYNVKTP